MPAKNPVVVVYWVWDPVSRTYEREVEQGEVEEGEVVEKVRELEEGELW